MTGFGPKSHEGRRKIAVRIPTGRPALAARIAAKSRAVRIGQEKEKTCYYGSGARMHHQQIDEDIVTALSRIPLH